MINVIGVSVGGAVLGGALTTLTGLPTEAISKGGTAIGNKASIVGIGLGSLVCLALYGLVVAAGV